jgi:hypothetical protein
MYYLGSGNLYTTAPPNKSPRLRVGESDRLLPGVIAGSLLWKLASIAAADVGNSLDELIFHRPRGRIDRFQKAVR